MMERQFAIISNRPDAHHDMGRRDTIDSLLDGRAKWPDGSVREIGVPLYERVRLRELERKRRDRE